MRTLIPQRPVNQAGKMTAFGRVRSFRLEVSEYTERGNRVANQFSSILKLFDVHDESTDIQEDSLIKEFLQEVTDARQEILRALELVNLSKEHLTRPLLETNERLSSVLQEYNKLIDIQAKNRRNGSKAAQRFDYVKERPKILTCIAETSHVSITLFNILRHADAASDTVRNNLKVQAYVSQIVDRQAELVNYIQLVENEEMIGTLLETEERATEALLLYEQLLSCDGSMPVSFASRTNASYEDPEFERYIFTDVEESGLPVAQAEQSNDIQFSTSDGTAPPPYSEIYTSPTGGSRSNSGISANSTTTLSSNLNHGQVSNQSLPDQDLIDPFADPV